MKSRLLLLSVWLLGVFAALCHYVTVFSLEQVEVRQAGGYADTIATLLEAESGDNLLTLDLEAWARRAARLPAVAGVRAHVTLSGRAVADVDLAPPLGLVDTEPVAGVTASGMLVPLVEHVPTSRLPLITGVGGTPTYYRASPDDRLHTGLAFIRAWNAQHRVLAERLAEVRVDATREVTIMLWPERRYIRMGRGDWPRALRQLYPVLSRLPAAGGELDMRFTGQVVEHI
jgi:hypothetical protein